MRARAGMTLVELLIVLLLAGLLSSLSVAALGGLAERLRDPMLELRRPLVEARRLAAERAEPVWVRIDAEGGYLLHAPGTQTTLGRGRLPLERLGPAPLWLRFHADGTSGPGEFCVRADGRWRRLRMDRVTGQAEQVDCPGCCPGS